jgi:micrococcal nuclease
MPNDEPGRIDNRLKIALGVMLLQIANRLAVVLISLIILVISSVACISSPSLSDENSQSDRPPALRPLQITPTNTISVLQQYECLPKTTLRQTGEVVNVIDGDTIHVRLDNGETYRLRYIGMDTPERDEYYFNQSTALNKQFVEGKTVTLVKDVSETDRFGRLLRYVLVDNLFVNYELVARGYAHAVTFPPDVACQPLFQEAERIARENELGLWASREDAAP